MAGSLQPRVKTWVSTEDVVYSDLNAEFDNVLLAMQPLLTDDYSTDVTQMQTATDPGEVGSESKATTLAGELARLRFIIKEITGENYWYESPIASLTGISNAIGGGLSPNRLVSGRMLATSAQPAFLVPNGAARTVKLDGTPTNFTYYVDGTSYTISTDVTLTSLTAAPSSNNTCLINDALATGAQDWTRNAGEDGTEIIVDTMGTEITSLIGKFAAFKLVGASTEYFLAYVASSTSLTKARRGFFFDSSDAPVKRTTYTNNDTISLMKLSWIYAKSDGTLEVGYTNPNWGKDEPLSPATGDFWYDTDNQTWKKYSGTAFLAASSTLVGVCIQDTTNTVGARSFEFFQNYADANTFEIYPESNSQVKTRAQGGLANVWGTTIKYEQNLITWDMTLDLESGVTEAASTFYYFYLTEEGDKVISNIKPYNRHDLFGQYHPHNSWRCLGRAFNNASSNLEQVESYYRSTRSDAQLIRSVAAVDVMLPSDRVITLSGASFTTNLQPAAMNRGVTLTFIHGGTSLTQVYTLARYGGDTISGATTVALHTNGQILRIMSDGTNWQIVSNYAQTAWADAGALTVTGSGGNPTKGTNTEKFWWRRHGSGLQYRYEYDQTALGSAAAGTAAYIWALPSNLAFDTTVVRTNGSVVNDIRGSYVGTGRGSAASDGAGNATFYVHVVPYSSTQFLIVYQSVCSSADGRLMRISGGTSTGIIANNLTFNQAQMSYFIEGSYPVSGWLP